MPRDNPLEVEAIIENKDIGFVKPEQEAEVKVETFLYTRYGTIHARVRSVSHAHRSAIEGWPAWAPEAIPAAHARHAKPSPAPPPRPFQ